MAANHLSTVASELPEYQAKNHSVSAIRVAGPSGGHSDTDSIYNADGSIKTGYISNWKSLSSEDKYKVTAERKRLGMNSNEKKRVRIFQNNKSGSSHTAEAKPRHTSEDLQQCKLSLTTNCD